MKVIKQFLILSLLFSAVPFFILAESNLNDPQNSIDLLTGDNFITDSGTVFEGYASGLQNNQPINLDLNINSNSSGSGILFRETTINKNGNFSTLVPNIFISNNFSGAFSPSDRNIVVNSNDSGGQKFSPCRDLNYVVCTEGPTKTRGTSVIMKGSWIESRNVQKRKPCAYGFMYFPKSGYNDSNTRCVYEETTSDKAVKSFQAKLDKLLPETQYYASAIAYYKCGMPFEGSHLCVDEKKYLQVGVDRVQGNYATIKTAPIKTFLEDITYTEKGVEITGSVFGYDLSIDSVQAMFLIKRVGKDGPWDIKTGIVTLPKQAYKDPKWKQGPNLFKATITGLQKDQLYYIRPYVSNGIAQTSWESISDPKEKTNIGRIDILTDDSVKPSVTRPVRVFRSGAGPLVPLLTVKQTTKEPLTFTLTASAISKAEDYWYSFKISDGKQEWCFPAKKGTKTGGMKDGIGYFSAKIGVSQYLRRCATNETLSTNSLLFVLKENTTYTVTAIVSNNAGYYANSTGKMKVGKIPPQLNTMNVPHFYQQDCAWGEIDLCPGNYKPMSLVGCGETSFAMILNYWWIYDSTFRNAWNRQNDNQAPDPEIVFRWEQNQRTQDCLAWNREKLAEVLGKMGLCIRDVTYNDPTRIQNKYLDRGIPLMMFCRPSNRTGNNQHIVTLLKFLSSPNGNTINKYAPRIGEYRQYLNNMTIHDSGGAEGAFATLATPQINAYGSRCGFQYDELSSDAEIMERGLNAFYPCYFNQIYTTW